MWTRPVVSEVPDPLQPLSVLLEALAFAHETIYDRHLDLIRDGRATPTSRGLLAESAEIVLQKTGAATASARRLAAQWHEQSVLDPQAADQTAVELETELADVESVLRELLARETAIDAQLRTLAAEER
jgi:hypothetical protein